MKCDVFRDMNCNILPNVNTKFIVYIFFKSGKPKFKLNTMIT